MKRVFLIISVLCTAYSSLKAQDEPKNYWADIETGLSISVGDSKLLTALSASKIYGIGNKKKKFKLGYGVRLNSFFGSNQDFITAPARLTSGEVGPQVLFTDIIEENLDTLFFKQSQANSFNISLHLGYEILPKFEVGFNIDALGVSFGKAQRPEYRKNGGNTLVQSIPTTFNLLLISDNDLGNLNSEIFVKYRFNDRWAVRAGASFLFTEYTASTDIQTEPEGNDRFRNKALLGMVSITWKPFLK
jgi:hypothetical protein